ncbi:DUF58 domain-containing protein [Staphylospora marina]|uniref:DUF58 domain-containing protein n=1 Tax=Staphylospora marina TaxID=2490858 RepID=UPI0013DE2704|nr:DUF58 domain-containing protein [Staphylospora marina]
MVRKRNGWWPLVAFTMLSAVLAVWVGGFVAGFLFWIGLGLLVYEGLVAMICFAGASVDRELSSTRLTAGEDLEVRLRVRRDFRWPLYWFMVRDKSDLEHSVSGLRAEFLVTSESEEFEYRVYHLKRGRYAFAGAELQAGDLFGFMSRTRFQEDPRTLTVYPRLMPVDKLPEGWSAGETNRKHRLLEDSGVVTGIRNYRHGDRLQLIHWKASSRGQGWKVKEFDRSASAQILLLLDQRASAYRGRGEHVFEHAVSLTASLVREWMDRRIPVSVMLGGKTPVRLPTVATEDQFMRLMEYLVDVKPDGSALPDVRWVFGHRGGGRLHVVMVCAAEDDAVRAFARELNRIGSSFQCLDVAGRERVAETGGPAKAFASNRRP